ncbi:hypothetical protein QTA56_15550 [Acinetobacter sp. VNH17]|uniref:Uncharacterized protein n=1 Tax=Acinetobacter thutiue TaxID=2998078 RepID=A0ABT7WSG6_9GAMM|nr:hypothetical protein [Acinetobacter thutiue]MCY6413527.1 hypothetical protein [Acinetobacter thutiue]MDN0015636.1 hypothetical protein [Acinetobacter thutiue]
MTDTLIQLIPDIKLEIQQLRLNLDSLCDELKRLNLITPTRTVSVSRLDDFPKKIKILNRKMRLIYNSFEIPNTWRDFSEILAIHDKQYSGKDVLDADIEYVSAAKHWAKISEYFLDFLIDANLNCIGIEAVTNVSLRNLESKYTSSDDESYEYKFQVLEKLKKIISSKMPSQTSHMNDLPTNSNFVSSKRIEELKGLEGINYDLCKLIRLCEELNIAYNNEAYFSTAMLVRSILDHVPPIFQLNTFSEVSSQYGSKSLKKSLQYLQNSSRNISDSFLHQPIRRNESLPKNTQVEFRSDLDVLLGEIFRILK